MTSLTPLHPPSACPHLSPLQVLSPSDLGLNQVIAVDGGGHGHPGQTAADELKHCHLSRGILHSNTVGTQAQVGAAAGDLLADRIIQVTVNDLL